MIQLSNITKKYRDNLILDGIDLTVGPGEFILIQGKSGSGKTTLLNILGGLEDVETGEYLFCNNAVKSSRDKRKLRRDGIGFIFQNFGLMENESVKENLSIVLNKKDRSDRYMNSVLNQVGLSDKILKRKIYELSGGEQQRVSIARALLKNTPVILADEPTGNLDPENTENIFRILKEINKRGKVIICVSHDIQTVIQPHKQFTLAKGKLLEEQG